MQFGKDEVNVRSVFRSIDGEVNCYDGIGQFSCFVRFAGCTAGCRYCDTRYSSSPDSGETIGVGAVFDCVMEMGCPKVTITGGEPLEQPNALKSLLKLLRYQGFFVSIETNGLHDVTHLLGDERVRFVVDQKLDSSGVFDNLNGNTHQKLLDIRQDNFRSLRSIDYVKFVIREHEDFKQAVAILDRWSMLKPKIAFSPVSEALDPAILVKWVEECEPNLRGRIQINLQIHKIIWPECGEKDER